MITSGNILCGVLSLVMTLHGHIVPAAWLVFVAMMFDFMDGKMARLLGGGSEFGEELDSLADMVSFGAAPALLLYKVALWDLWGILGALTAAFFVICGALRLARFNVTHSDGNYFEGLPIPGAALLLSSLVFGGMVPLPPVMALVTLGTASLMVSSVPFGNLKQLQWDHVNQRRLVFLAGLLVVLAVVFQERSPLVGTVIYVVSGFFRFDWGAWLTISWVPSRSTERDL
ncbi:MAG: CDP-diacylglycerol--serine O-phosphatidyltransferase [Synergistales bacterium]|nr:CDP-diacylglycerol--serine O-phosphatidyltransferase [Synergistales bacterium]